MKCSIECEWRRGCGDPWPRRRVALTSGISNGSVLFSLDSVVRVSSGSSAMLFSVGSAVTAGATWCSLLESVCGGVRSPRAAAGGGGESPLVDSTATVSSAWVAPVGSCSVGAGVGSPAAPVTPTRLPSTSAAAAQVAPPSVGGAASASGATTGLSLTGESADITTTGSSGFVSLTAESGHNAVCVCTYVHVCWWYYANPSRQTYMRQISRSLNISIFKHLHIWKKRLYKTYKLLLSYIVVYIMPSCESQL